MDVFGKSMFVDKSVFVARSAFVIGMCIMDGLLWIVNYGLLW